MPKILVAYPGAQNLEAVVNKTNGLNGKSGPFDITLFLGDVLSELNRSEVTPNIEAQHPIYFTSGLSPVDDADPSQKRDLPQNFSYLGDYGVYSFSNGIKLAFVTGDETILNKELEQIKSTLENKQIDILITFQWPKVIAQEAKLFLGNSKIDELVRLIRPKYHFATGSNAGKFYERAPFQWDDGTITRFISLSKFSSKEKWIYAFNYNQHQDEKAGIPKNLTSNPFEVLETANASLEVVPEDMEDREPKKRRAENNSMIITGSQVPMANQEETGQAVKRQAIRKAVLPENCFFCLSNPKLQSHMIISIGEHAYLTIAKGPLTRPTEKMKFSGHCLIIPIAHTPKLQNIKNDAENGPLLNEIIRYEVSLVKFFASFELGTVLFQINKSNSVHFHIQVFPIPVDFLPDFEKTLSKNAKLNNTKFQKNVAFNFKKYADESDPEFLELLNSNKDYVSFTVFNKSVLDKSIYVSEIGSLESPLDLQFGRRVLAYLLQIPKRIKWDKCQQSEQTETSETEAFKKSFKEYDFTMGV